MVVEGRPLQPLDGSDEQQLARDRLSIGTDDVELDVVRPRPVRTDSASGWQHVIREKASNIDVSNIKVTNIKVTNIPVAAKWLRRTIGPVGSWSGTR